MEPTQEPTPEPTVSNPVAELPDVSLDMTGETFSFEQAIEQAIEQGNTDVTPQQETSPEATPDVTPEATPDATIDPTQKTATETDGSDSGTEEPIEELTDEISDDWTPKAAKAFKATKNQVKTLTEEVNATTARLREIEARNKELEATIGDSTREELQKRIEEFEQQQMLNNLEESAAYRRAVTEPLNQIAEQADAIATKYGVDSNELLHAMAMNDEAKQAETISELLVDASDRDKGRIYALIENVDPILARKSELRESVAEATKEAELLAEQERERELADRLETRNNVARNVVARIGQKLPFIKELDGVDLEGIQEQAAKVDISEAHPVDQVYSSVASKLLPHLVKAYVMSQRTIDTLTGKLAEYDDAEPTMSPQGNVNQINRQPTQDLSQSGKVSFLEAFETSLKG